MYKLKCGTAVKISRFGDGKECIGIVVGLASADFCVDSLPKGYRSYIVELPMPNPWENDYRCIVVSDACLDLV